MSYSERRSLEALRRLNAEFQADSLPFGRVHKALQALGADPERCVVFACYPDSGDTVVLKYVSLENAVYEADIDLSADSGSTLEKVGEFPRGGNRATQIEDSSIRTLLDELQRLEIQ